MFAEGTMAPSRAMRVRIALVAWVAVATLFTSAARAEDEKTGLSEEDAACLKCHGKEGFSAKLPDGKTRPLYVSARDFAASVHVKDGCAACHSEEGEECLEKKGSAFGSRREHSVHQMKGCVDCHKVAVKGYEKSVHAALLKSDDKQKAAKTAVCSDCHKLHAERFFEAKNKCLSCHEDTQKQHRGWLPKTARHLDTVSCEACHAPSAQRRVTLRLYEGGAPVAASAGVPQFRKTSAGADGKVATLDARAVWSLLNEFSQGDGETRTVLRGTLEVRSQAEGHEVAEKSKAIRDCATCHREGSDAFKSVTVSIIGPDGKALHAPADKAILNSLESLGSVGGFYVLGATRIKLLDQLLLLTVVAGAAIPIGHLTLRMISRRIRSQREARRARERSQQ